MQQEICFYSPDALAQARIPAVAAAAPPSTRCCLSAPAAAAGNEGSRTFALQEPLLCDDKFS